MADGREQDTWFVSVVYRNGIGKDVLQRRGILDLPHPMTAFDAADHAVRVEVRDVVPLLGEQSRPHEIHAVIWSKREPDRAAGRFQACGALATYDPEKEVFMRLTPWISDNAREEVGTAEGAVFHSLDWQ